MLPKHINILIFHKTVQNPDDDGEGGTVYIILNGDLMDFIMCILSNVIISVDISSIASCSSTFFIQIDTKL